jgi:hypothetical protein
MIQINRQRVRETIDLLWQCHREVTSNGWTLYRRTAEEMQMLLDRDEKGQGRE